MCADVTGLLDVSSYLEVGTEDKKTRSQPSTCEVVADLNSDSCNVIKLSRKVLQVTHANPCRKALCY